MVGKAKIGLGISLGVLLVSGILNVWFYVESQRMETKLEDMIESREYWMGTATELEIDFNDYQQSHSYTNNQYQSGREESYSRGFSEGYEDGYNTAEFKFYYVKPKNQRYGLENLKDIVNEYSWTSSYEEGVFDCSEMSAYMERHLENEGFHTIILLGESPFGSGTHAWVLAETSEGKYMPVEATSPRVVLWEDTGFEKYFEYDHDFETIQEALNHLSTDFDWWSVYP